MEKLKRVLLYLIGLYFAQMFIQHGIEKFDPEGFWSGAFIKRWSYGLNFMYFIGVLELVGGVLLVIPFGKISRYGAFLLSLVMLGALITRVVFGTSLGDAIAIAFNCVLLFYIAVDYEIIKVFNRLKKRIKK